MTRPIPVVVGALVKENKILLIKRVKPPFENIWSMPAGKVEYGESIDQAVARELKEETGLDVTFQNVQATVNEHVFENNSLFIHTVMFLCNILSNGFDAKNNGEGELRWFDLPTLESHKAQIIPSDYEMIKRLILSKGEGHFNSVIEKVNGSYILKEFKRS